MSPARHTTHNPRHGLGSRLGWREISTGGTTPTPDSARSESGARADWQACTTHAFLLDHRTSCTVFRAIVVFAMTIMARSFTTHLTSFVVHRVRFGPDSRESGPNPGTGTHLTSLLSQLTISTNTKHQCGVIFLCSV